MRLRLTTLVLILLSGCASVTRTPYEETEPVVHIPEPRIGRYEPDPGNGAQRVEQLRAAPAPAQLALEDGKNRQGDGQRLRMQGYVRVGTGYYPDDAKTWRDVAVHQGEEVGADKLLSYRPADSAEDIVDYYVRFRLPFGASFRSLDGAERTRYGNGVVLGEVVGGTPASEANLRAGDVVTSFDGKPVADKAAFQELLKTYGGKQVKLGIERAEEHIERGVRLGVAPTKQ